MSHTTYRSSMTFLLACTLLLPACQSHNLRAVDAQKAPTHTQWADQRIDGLDPVEFAKRRAAILVCGYEQIVADINADRTSIVAKKGASGGGCGAVAIAPDGYFLTAGHCAAPGPMCILPICPGRQTSIPARLIATFNRGESGGADFALIHADIPTPEYARPAIKVEPDAPVLCVGSGIASRFISAGRAMGQDGLHAGDIPIRVIFHSAPLYLGDSGGPVFNAAGELVGISVSSEFALVKSPQAEAQLPDPAALVRLIDADRTINPSNTAPASTDTTSQHAG